MNLLWLGAMLICAAALFLLVNKSDTIVNLAFLKKTLPAVVLQRQSYENKNPPFWYMYSGKMHSYIFAVEFQIDGDNCKWFFVTEAEFLCLREKTTGVITYRGKHFIRFKPDTDNGGIEK